MTASSGEPRGRRIVVVFGGGSADASVAGVLASLVSESPADVTGVFIEDLALFRLAELPFTTEVCRVTTMRRPLMTTELERQMRIQASRAERTVRQVAEQVGSRWSFRKHRGRLSSALAEATDVDWLLLGAARRALATAGELSATARTVRASEAEARRPIAVIVERADVGSRAIDAALELAQRSGRGLILFLPPETSTATAEIARRLQALGPRRVSVRTVSSSDADAMLSAVRRAGPAALVVDAGEGGFEQAKIDALRRDLSCPLLVVRSAALSP